MRLLVFLLASRFAGVVSVDGCHGDRDKDHRPRLTCSAAGLSGLPAGLEPSTQVLRFPTNLFTSLSWSSFQTFPDIYEIDLTNNKVPELMASSAAALPSLSVLRLSWNLLRSLPAQAFSACPALLHLQLDNNAITQLNDATFSGLSKLEILDLSNNQIGVLPPLMLHPLTAIETLDLSSNKIRVMPDQWFAKKEEVPYLFLSLNPWLCSCSLSYFRRYLEDYDYNVYVRDSLTINNDAFSVVCDSPAQYKHTALLSLEESVLCALPTHAGPAGDVYEPPTPTAATVAPATSTPGTMAPATPTQGTVATAPPPPPPPTTAALTPLTTTLQPFPLTAQPTKEVSTWGFWAVTWSWLHTTTRRLKFQSLQSPTVAMTVPQPPSSRMSTAAPPKASSPWILAASNANVATTLAPTPAPTVAPAAITTTTTTTTTTTAAITTAAITTTTTAAITTAAITTPTAKVGWIRGQAGAEGVFCLWLFAGSVVLGAAAAACTLLTAAKLVVWYRNWYKPLARRRRMGAGPGEGVRLLPPGRKREPQEPGGGGVKALYRSVLFIDREGEVRGERPAREGAGAGPEPEPEAREITAGGTAGFYRKTLYRLWSRQEEIEGWRDVMEESRVPTEGGGGAPRKRYSVIVREEREGAGGGRAELDWVLGKWEVRGSQGTEPAEASRSSWGEWLVDFLPSMPWSQTTPAEAEAAQGAASST